MLYWLAGPQFPKCMMYGMLLPEAINNPILSVFQLFGLVVWEYINITLAERLWLVKQVLKFVHGPWELGQISIAAAGEEKISKGIWRWGVWQSSDLGLPGHPLPNWREEPQCLFVGWVQSQGHMNLKKSKRVWRWGVQQSSDLCSPGHLLPN